MRCVNKSCVWDGVDYFIKLCILCEIAVVSFIGGVYRQNETQWVPIAERACVWLTHNTELNIYRIMARSKGEYILNYTIHNTLYCKSSPLFFQWKNQSGEIYALNLPNDTIAEKFVAEFQKVISMKSDVISEGEDDSEDASKSEEPPYVALASVLNPVTAPDTTVSQTTPECEVTDPTALAEKEQKRIRTRDRAAKEIYDSEMTYVKSLDQFLKVWINPMKEKKMISEQDSKDLFSNLETILDFSQQLGRDLGKRMENWTQTQKIGEIFISLHPYLRLYKTYCDNYDQSLDTLEKITKKKAVAQFLKQCEARSNGFSITFYMIMPVQRVPRYSLLLRELIANTDKNHPDLPDLSKAMELIGALAGDINQSVVKAEKARAMAGLLKRNFQGLETLIEPHRHLVLDGAMSVSYNAVECTWVLVFNDMIAFAATDKKEKKEKKDKNPRRLIQGFIEFSACWAKQCGKVGEDAIELKTPEATVLVRTKVEKRDEKNEEKQPTVKPPARKTTDWCDQIQQCIRNWLTTPAMTKDSDEITINKDILKDNLCEVRYTHYKFKDGSIYKGHWLNAKFQGPGRFMSPNGTVFEGTFERGALHGHATATWANGDKFVGEWQRDMPHGEGTLTYTDGTVYAGGWVNGRRKGKGTMTWPNGDVYVGEFDMDRINGRGVLTSKQCHSSYDGDFKDDLRQGTGTLTYTGYNFSGNWENNVPHGQGKEVSQEDGTYEGNYINGKKEGEGLWTSSNGNMTLLGDWKNNRFHGNGKLVVKDIGYVYVGMFVEGKKEGHGTETVHDKLVYEGEWDNDMYQGKGTWYGINGDKYTGTWHQGQKYGSGQLAYANRNEYYGEWYRDRKEGQGTFTFSNGTLYRGAWVDDLPHGDGEFHFSKDIFYSGEWLNGKKHGKGTLTTPKGIFTGNWVNGRRTGPGVWKSGSSTYEGEWSNDKKNGPGVLLTEGGEIRQVWKGGSQVMPGIKYFPPELPEIPYLNWNIFS